MLSVWEMLAALSHYPDVIDRECDEEHKDYQRPDSNVLRPDTNSVREVSVVGCVPVAVSSKCRLCVLYATGKSGSEDDDCDDDQQTDEATDNGVHRTRAHPAFSTCHLKDSLLNSDIVRRGYKGYLC
jgi:hypothetical protein